MVERAPAPAPAPTRDPAPTHEIDVRTRTATVAFGRDLDPREVEYVHEVLASVLTRIEKDREAPPPRVVHVEPEYETLEVKTYDPKLVTIGSGHEAVVPPPAAVETLDGKDGPVEVPYWTLAETRQTNRSLACPDCGREIIAAPDPARTFDYLICPSIPANLALPACHAGCVVACGRDAT